MRLNPMELYSHLDGKILYDPEGRLAERRGKAELLFHTYQIPEVERKALVYWLEGARRQLQTAQNEQAQLKMSLASTQSWKILEDP